MRRPSGLLLASLLPLAACSSSSASPVDAAPPADASHPHDTSTPVDAHKTSDAGVDAHKSVDTGVDAPTDADDADVLVTDAPFDASGFVPIDGGASAITGVTPETWTWVPFPESKCRDGSTTGLGVNFNPESPNLLIYLEGGGACFNVLTCAVNPSSFGAADFPQRFPTDGDGGPPESGNGILDRTNSQNPVKDWNFIYVPYCTGDIHAGNNPDGSVLEVAGTQQFVGYQNINLFLQRIVPTFPSATQVLLTGISGGGFGAAANYAHVQRAFGSVPVNMLDDSGPFMENPYLPGCLQNQVRGLWGLDSTVGADCEGNCNDPQTFFIDLAHHFAKSNPTRHFGLMDSTDDMTITTFFGFGDNDCMDVTPETADVFTAGLEDIRTQFGSPSNLGTFYFVGTDHTSLGDDSFYQRDTNGADGGPSVLLTDWVSQFVQGNTSNAGP